MKTLQITLAGGLIITAVFTGQYLMTDNVKIVDPQNVGIVNEAGETISNAGSAADVAANYPTLKLEVEAAVEEYKKQNSPEIISEKFTYEDPIVTIEAEVKMPGTGIFVVEGFDGNEWAAFFNSEAAPFKFEVDKSYQSIRFYVENEFGKSEPSEEFSIQ